MADKPTKRQDDHTGTDMVGHEWDGIEELDTPMPRWWLLTFYATLLWGLVYVVLYPAWPLVNSATAGVLGWTSHDKLHADLAARDKQLEPIRRELVAMDIETIDLQRLSEDNPAFFRAVVQGGESAFKVYCVQCHGTGAAGLPNYPNLNDDEWLWGGDLAAIEYTLVHGIRNPDHDETRFSQMPAYGRDGLLNSTEIADLVSYVRVLSNKEEYSASAQRGAVLYQANCVACHGENAQGDRSFGAPNLTDAISLYGLDRASLTHTMVYSRNGVMPRWGHRLDKATIRMLAIYIHSLGGGEHSSASMQVETQAENRVESSEDI